MWREGQREKTRYSWITHAVFKLLIWSDDLCEFIYSFNLHAILNGPKCFVGISLILKSKAAGMSNVIYAQSRTEIQDLIKHNSIVQRIVKHDFTKTFHGFSWPYEPWMWRSGAGRVRLSKSDKNIGAGGWRVDNLFEAADSGDVLAHPRITSVCASVYI